jgi:hypothetical protein
MERLPRLSPAAGRGPVAPQLQDHQLAERVVQVSRIVRAAQSLLPCIARVEQRALQEQSFLIGHGHALRVQSDRGQVAYIALQRPDELANVRLGVARAQAGVPHHLLAVMRPALVVCVADE